MSRSTDASSSRSEAATLHFDSWHKERIDVGELTTVRDVLAAADPALVADALHPRYADLARSRGEGVPSFSKVWEDTERILGDILSTPAGAEDNENVLIAKTTYWSESGRAGAISLGTEASLVKRRDLPLYARYLEGDYSPDPLSGEAPINGWAFELDPWEEILAFHVWVPGRMCEREVCQFVGDVIWEMTFFGDDHETADEERSGFAEELERSMAEVEEAKAAGMPLEEAFTVYDPATDLEELGMSDAELDYMRRVRDVEYAISEIFRRDFHRDCVELAGRLGMRGE